MPGMAIEDRLDVWSAELRGAKERLSPLFGRPTVAAAGMDFLDGLPGPERCRDGLDAGRSRR